MKRIIVTGPTASGKGALAVELARELGAEIISVDSMKIFRRMDVGTAKPPAELRREISFHFIDIVEPWEDYSVGRYLPQALETAREIEERGRPVVFAGGTALYLNALLSGFFAGPEADWDLRRELLEEAERRGLDALHRELAAADPEVARRIHPNDRKRIVRALEVLRLTGRRISEHWEESALRLQPGAFVIFGITVERSELYRRIDRRVERMVERGLFAEARSLLEDPRGVSRCAAKCIGYREIFDGLARGVPEPEIIARIQRDTRRFAKQQMTWFRRFPIRWLGERPPGELACEVIAAARG